MKRRDFLKTACVGAIAAGAGSTLIGCTSGKPETFNFNKLGTGKGMKLSFEPYELQLRHTFTVSSYSRKTTPGVQVALIMKVLQDTEKHRCLLISARPSKA